MLVIEIELKGFFGVGGVAWFHASDVAVDPIECGDGLAKLLPLVLRGAPEGETQRDFIVATEEITQLGGEFAEVADLCLDFHVLGRKKRRIRRGFDDFSLAILLN